MENNLDQIFSPSPNDLVSAVLGVPQPAKGADPVPDPTPAPEEPNFGGVQVSAFNAALPLATEGLVNSVDDIRSLHLKAQQAAGFAQRVSELESQQFKAASPFVEKLNALIADGADQSRVAAFWSLATADLDNMQPLDVISFSTKLEHPNLSDKDVRAYVLDKYGLDGEDIDINSLPAAKMAQLKIESSQAKAKLEAERVRLETVAPKSAAVDNSAELRKVQGDASATFWNEVLASVPITPKFSYEDKEKGIPQYDFNFTPRPEVLAAAREAVLNHVRTNPDAYPKNQAGAVAITEAVNQLVMAHSTQDFMRAMFLDVYNEAMAAAAQRNSGPVPTRVDARGAPPADNKRPQSLAELMRTNQ